MKILIIGSGMMSRAIAYDLRKRLMPENITILDKNKNALQSVKNFFENGTMNYHKLDIEKLSHTKHYLKNFEIVISAIPYTYNYYLAKIAIETKTHFLDLGGNNSVVKKERNLFKKAKNNDITIIPDCGLAPGITSVIAKDIAEQLDHITFLKIRVGGLPIDPKPPLNYQITFSPFGLINEYVDDAIVLAHGKVCKKKSMTEIEKIKFPPPFGEMEAFLTSGGCSTLPYTFKKKIDQLDYKTIRYPGHCEKFKTILDLGFAEEKEIKIGNQYFVPKNILATILLNKLPVNGKDVVLLKVFGEGIKDWKKVNLEYSMIDYYDEKNNMTAMMRTTGFSVSIIAQMIANSIIYKRGVYCPEEIIPCKPFFEELKKRNIVIKKNITYV